MDVLEKSFYVFLNPPFLRNAQKNAIKKKGGKKVSHFFWGLRRMYVTFVLKKLNGPRFPLGQGYHTLAIYILPLRSPWASRATANPAAIDSGRYQAGALATTATAQRWARGASWATIATSTAVWVPGGVFEGPAKQKSTDPSVHLLNPRTPHPPSDFFLSTFLGVSRQGEFKNTIKIFLQKFHVKNFSPKNRQKFRCQFFLDLFIYRVFGCFSAMGDQTTTKNVLQNKSCRKVFTKKSIKKSSVLDFF
jgi:hypothetical protein